MGRESSPRAKKPGTIHSDGLETVQYCGREIFTILVTRYNRKLPGSVLLYTLSLWRSSSLRSSSLLHILMERAFHKR